MQLFPEVNKVLAAKSFDADVFTAVMYLGASTFVRLSGSTKLCFRKGDGERLTYLRMNLQENEGGFDRLKIHLQANDTVRMEFYAFTPMPAGMNSLKGVPTVMEDVALDYMGPVFQDVTGLNMQGAASTPC